MKSILLMVMLSLFMVIPAFAGQVRHPVTLPSPGRLQFPQLVHQPRAQPRAQPRSQHKPRTHHKFPTHRYRYYGYRPYGHRPHGYSPYRYDGYRQNYIRHPRYYDGYKRGPSLFYDSDSGTFRFNFTF